MTLLGDGGEGKFLADDIDGGCVGVGALIWRRSTTCTGKCFDDESDLHLRSSPGSSQGIVVKDVKPPFYTSRTEHLSRATRLIAQHKT